MSCCFTKTPENNLFCEFTVDSRKGHPLSSNIFSQPLLYILESEGFVEHRYRWTPKDADVLVIVLHKSQTYSSPTMWVSTWTLTCFFGLGLVSADLARPMALQCLSIGLLLVSSQVPRPSCVVIWGTWLHTMAQRAPYGASVNIKSSNQNHLCMFSIYLVLDMQGVLLGSPLDRSTDSPIHEEADKHMRGGRETESSPPSDIY